MNRLLKVVAIVATLGFGFALAYRIYEYQFYKRAIPQQINVLGAIQTGSDFNPNMLLAPMRYEFCGGTVFSLSPETAQAIQDQGISFFENASHGRGYPEGSERHHFYSYTPWQATPIPDKWTSESTWIGLSCIGLNRRLQDEIMQAAQQEGAFFSTKPDAILIVIPTSQLVIYTYYG